MAEVLSRRFRNTTSRLHGPGGLYNLGNFLGLTVGVGVVCSSTVVSGASFTTVILAVVGHLAGSPAAVLTTLASVIFVLAGEAYHRAFARRQTPSVRWTICGDLGSGLGAIVFACAMTLMGNPALAAVSGLLHAGGKFGSAAIAGAQGGWGGALSRWSDVFRLTVLASRLPALMLALGGLLRTAVSLDTADGLLLLATIVCVLLWGWADAMLLWSTRPAKSVEEVDSSHFITPLSARIREL